MKLTEIKKFWFFNLQAGFSPISSLNWIKQRKPTPFYTTCYVSRILWHSLQWQQLCCESYSDSGNYATPESTRSRQTVRRGGWGLSRYTAAFSSKQWSQSHSTCVGCDKRTHYKNVLQLFPLEFSNISYGNYFNLTLEWVCHMSRCCSCRRKWR